MEFCKCGSIKVRGNCSNKKCNEHTKALVNEATYQQIEYIRNLAERLGEDTTGMDFEYMSKQEASNLIKKYLERLEVDEA
ncbi:MAG: hypothetical protein N3B21_14550 [Clostridia bacterium]|nr:hypothetical protein [Clostridia bacterium]